MALLKEYSQGTKQGNYWKIIGVYHDHTYLQTQVKVALFLDKAASDADPASYVMSKMFSVDNLCPNKEDTYEALKKLPEFTGSKDV